MTKKSTKITVADAKKLIQLASKRLRPSKEKEGSIHGGVIFLHTVALNNQINGLGDSEILSKTACKIYRQLGKAVLFDEKQFARCYQ